MENTIQDQLNMIRNDSKNEVYKKLQQARAEITKVNLKMSGFNKFANFKYYELGDILPTSNIIFEKYGLCPIFSIVGDEATLEIMDASDCSSVKFITPVANADVKGANAIQNLGSQHTYLKRYLYLNALELAEGDVINAVIDKDKAETNQSKAQPKTVQPVQEKAVESQNNVNPDFSEFIQKDYKTKLQDALNELGYDKEAKKDFCVKHNLTKSSTDDDYRIALDKLLGGE